MSYSSLEEHYMKKKLELVDEATEAVRTSDIPVGLVKDYIYSLILQEKERLENEGKKKEV